MSSIYLKLWFLNALLFCLFAAVEAAVYAHGVDMQWSSVSSISDLIQSSSHLYINL